jgi:hypothetical protein
VYARYFISLAIMSREVARRLGARDSAGVTAVAVAAAGFRTARARSAEEDDISALLIPATHAPRMVGVSQCCQVFNALY